MRLSGLNNVNTLLNEERNNRYPDWRGRQRRDANLLPIAHTVAFTDWAIDTLKSIVVVEEEDDDYDASLSISSHILRNRIPFSLVLNMSSFLL